MRTVPRGIAATNRFDATDTDTAAAVGNPGVEAVATVALILWIEATCGELMAPYLDDGEAGVGVRVAVDHTGPAFAGRPVEVHARVGGVDRRRVTFSVRLVQDGRDVMTGEHVRAAVDLARFLGARTGNAIPSAEPGTEPVGKSVPESVTEPTTESAPDSVTEPTTESAPESVTEPTTESAPDSVTKPTTESAPDSVIEPITESVSVSVTEPVTEPVPESAPTQATASATKPAIGPTVTFYFDVHSPWSYLASALIGPLARRRGARIEWRPIHLANLMDRIGGLRPLEQTPARVAWYRQDIADRMAQHRLPYDPHPDYPLRPSRALRCCVHAAERGCADAFVGAVMRGYWVEKKDISDLAVLQAIADAVGLGSRPVVEVVGDASIKVAVARNTDEAVARGVFGVPSFVFDGKLFFGSDRMDLLDLALGRRTGGRHP